MKVKRIYLFLSYLMAICTYFSIEIKWRYFIIITLTSYIASIVFYSRSIDKKNQNLLFFIFGILQISVLITLFFIVFNYVIIIIITHIGLDI